MYIAITPNKVYQSRSLKGIENQLKGKFEVQDFKSIGTDHICTLTENDLSFIQDKGTMSRIIVRNLYKGENLKIFLIVTMILQIILLIKPSG